VGISALSALKPPTASWRPRRRKHKSTAEKADYRCWLKRPFVKPGQSGPIGRWGNPMKRLALAAFAVLSLAVAAPDGNAAPQSYRAPAYNYYQNNWMSGR
jgi:hypothetical protein